MYIYVSAFISLNFQSLILCILINIALLDCGKNCTEWIDMTLVKKDFNCTLIQKRSCENLILAQSAEEVREITTSCPQDPPTGSYVEFLAVLYLNTCTLNCQVRCCKEKHFQKDKTTLFLFCSYNAMFILDLFYLCRFFLFVTINHLIVAAASSPSSNGESNTYKYLSITLAIACLLLGFFVGAFWHKKYHEKSCLHSGSSNITPEGKSLNYEIKYILHCFKFPTFSRYDIEKLREAYVSLFFCFVQSSINMRNLSKKRIKNEETFQIL